MCGIVGYIGNKEIKNILLEGLKELEYRGYDSSGVAFLQKNSLNHFKAVGKLENLIQKTAKFSTKGFGVGIGHTRWATHGKPTEINAHPHLGDFSYVVHNGIIENYQEIKNELSSRGVNFLSQTDTESIVHLFENFYKQNVNSFESFKSTIQSLKGAYSVLLITKADPSAIFFAKKGSPLLVGKSLDKDEIFFASSDAAMIENVKEAIFLEDGEYGYAKDGEVFVFDKNGQKDKNFVSLSIDKISAQKQGFRFFMEKEIYEQSEVANEVLMGRIKNDEIFFEEFEDYGQSGGSEKDSESEKNENLANGKKDFLKNIEEIKICACGTSYHSALVASYLFERYAKIRCTCEVASEFRYKEPYLNKKTLFVVISQSGETADTLEALKMAKNGGLKTLAICNVDNSSIVRLSDRAILTRAGIEKGVASTKAFVAQTIILWMLSLYFAKNRNKITKKIYQKDIDAIRHLPLTLKIEQDLHEKLKRLSKRYLHGHGFFFIGRDVFYPLALEGALKLKEISYLHAEGYPAGEMKHGPIALADSELFTVALMPNSLLYDKIKSNVEELCARDATILAISPNEFHLSDDFVKTNEKDHFMLEFFEMTTILQLFSMEIAIRLGNDVDMPRNLAKSVTVE